MGGFTVWNICTFWGENSSVGGASTSDKFLPNHPDIKRFSVSLMPKIFSILYILPILKIEPLRGVITRERVIVLFYPQRVI
ncbi:MAG TPA: hypothetical protein PLQ00_11470, partial [Thermoguttaceae bacterium]|nr:hypothetical protein [Thermoguttaceae bacterium]